MTKQSLHRYPLFVAMTRQPMMMGVTQTFFVLNIVPSLCVFLITKNVIFSIGLFLILHVVGVIGCAKDERFFDILRGKLALSCPNRKIWGCNSYDPT